MTPALLALLKHVPNKRGSNAHTQLRAESLALQMFRQIADNPTEPQLIEVCKAQQNGFSPLTVALVNLLRQALEPKGYEVYFERVIVADTSESTPQTTEKEVVTVK